MLDQMSPPDGTFPIQPWQLVKGQRVWIRRPKCWLEGEVVLVHYQPFGPRGLRETLCRVHVDLARPGPMQPNSIVISSVKGSTWVGSQCPHVMKKHPRGSSSGAPRIATH